ncbi:uncharacterized protein LOC141698529 [Apium graveolens]|uniref:uncharacterized protein LOC141698529 n=1 Tax=Apium graveolens TaxID=4045 RepID=UPI003D7ABF2D
MAHIRVWNAMKAFDPDLKPYITTDLKFQTPHAYWSDSYRSSITLMNKGIEREYNKISNILTAVDLSCNKFTGEIPESFGSLGVLQLLNLFNNVLTGQIPSSLGNLRQLESLDLSQNKLSGVIPQQLAAQLTFLAFFNVSCNLLSGRIPQGPQFRTFDSSSFISNSRLCGFPLPNNCMTVGSPTDDVHDNDEDEDDSNDNNLPSGFDPILAGVVSGLVVGIVMGNILMDKHTWAIDGIVQNFGGTQKNRRRQKRQNIRN